MGQESQLKAQDASSMTNNLVYSIRSQFALSQELSRLE